MNLANKLTVLRIFLVPIFLIFITVKNIPYGTVIATVIFIIASATDKLDGYIARSRNQITTFGKIMDPLADKLLVTSALICLVDYQLIPGWAAIIIIAREFAVTGLRTVASAEGIVIAASKWGKAKTVTQIVAIIFGLINLNYNQNTSILTNIITIKSTTLMYITNFMMAMAIIITIISGVDYFVKNKNVVLKNK
ncbi:CDP-diacylglycerol--glycerol-3-phosphate 3-phosphatidyltransferase [Clostridium niameyense]|uniref:CDP-diacylglycerol--glycerol-3-phosphate 3-phosphatidyltransferase n=1 Tax=Clostridium niameyense TaxID=1622073 RepID=A0A6M0R7A3_9CLOT|nr:CDP-diacylglycerol--glycerol-3-phosphate 3-phosphatidyltransferase [Clostridium niameyense]NEZ46101.1 CDP-diacylglycerol--glycerol-3-phosphate 3-phosphatidyltransferase [Clostridium niameyense]